MSGMDKFFEKYIDAARSVDTIKSIGHVTRVQGLIIESRGPQAAVGEICTLDVCGNEVMSEVVALDGPRVSLMPYADVTGIKIGSPVKATGGPLSVVCSPELLGRIWGPDGRPIDGKGPITGNSRRPVLSPPPAALSRPSIKKRLITGVRAVDGLLACGEGQRLGIFSGSGVGKSTFQGMMARNTSADVNVIALVGERGRELNDFIAQSLGEEGLARSIVVVATSDQSALARLRGAYTATTVAEYFRDRGMQVMLLFDSVTRFAQAQREIALSTGEVPAQRGYTPSVFELLPKLLERAGTSERGSITAFYTVLVDGGDMDEPISDNVRAILDGHIVLSRRLASRGHYPAVDILQSISRLANDVTGPKTKEAVRLLRRWLSDYAEAEDMIDAGAYKSGSNSDIDIAIEKHKAIEDFLVQGRYEKSTLAETLGRMSELTVVDIPD
jgi:flagellum-specific ATP synthase